MKVKSYNLENLQNTSRKLPVFREKVVASARLRDWEKTKHMFSVKYLAKDYKFKVSWKHHLPMIFNGGSE